MINFNAITQTKAFARQDGVFLSMLWMITFALVVYLPKTDLGGLLVFSTPLFVAWRMIRFRNYALDGIMSYRRALVYCFYTFFYASLLFGVALFIYFRFIDNGRFLGVMSSAVFQMMPLYKQNGVSTQQLTDGLAMLEQLTPMELSFLIFIYGIMIGWFCSIFIAFFAKLKH